MVYLVEKGDILSILKKVRELVDFRKNNGASIFSIKEVQKYTGIKSPANVSKSRHTGWTKDKFVAFEKIKELLDSHPEDSDIEFSGTKDEIINYLSEIEDDNLVFNITQRIESGS